MVSSLMGMKSIYKCFEFKRQTQAEFCEILFMCRGHRRTITTKRKYAQKSHVLYGENLSLEYFARKKKSRNFRDLLSRMRSLEHFRRDKLSRLDVKSIKFCEFSEFLRFLCFLKEKEVFEYVLWENLSRNCFLVVFAGI